jgi:cytoskeletal protein CcmA (bactofilin family)
VTIKRSGMEIKGRMHIKGDLDVKGTVTVAKGAELRIDGKRTLHGKLEGEITYGLAQQQQSFAGKELRSMT